MCPQQNVLFSYLTVKEHLELFAALKGVPLLHTDLEVQDMVVRLGLSDKMHSRASSLSGGMQRKLQVLPSSKKFWQGSGAIQHTFAVMSRC